MEIIINYTSKWGNSFLSEPDKKGNRDYIASLSKMNSGNNKDNKLGYYQNKDITNNTVYGLLYRFLGARKSLNKILKEDQSFIIDLIKNKKISFLDKKYSITDESVYLRNKSKSTDQNSFSGIPNDYILTISDFKEAFEVLFYSRNELLSFILYDKKINLNNNFNLLDISNKLNLIYKDKSLYIAENEYHKINKINKNLFNKEVDLLKGNLGLVAINKSIKELEKKYISNEKIKNILTNNFTLSGISLNGKSFTQKDFMKKFANSKIVYGNPYQTDFWIINKINGKNKKFEKKLTKTNGTLTIKIDCDYKTANCLKEMINSAGVSSFYLGKKGLAYIDQIII